LKLRDKEIKLDQIVFCASFECKWNTFPSSMLGIIIVLANSVLRSILETIRKENQHFTLN